MNNKTVLARLEAEIAKIDKTLQELNGQLAFVREDRTTILSMIETNRKATKKRSEILFRLKSDYRIL